MKNSNVLRLPGVANSPADALEDALAVESVTDVLILSYEEGGELVLRSSGLNRAEALFMILQAERSLLEEYHD